MPKRVVCALAQCQRTQVGPHPPRAQRYGTCLGHRLDLELPIGHPVELWSISRHFAAQIPSLGQRSLCSQVINFLLSDRSLGMPIHSLASRGRATQLSFSSSHASLCDKPAAELQAHSSHVATLC